jgi:hypothetical protein
VNTASTLAMHGCVVYANGDADPRTYGGASQRIAGGVLISQASLAAAAPWFTANRVSANAGDQLAFESSGAWSIAPGTSSSACPLASLFACVEKANGSYAVGVAGGGTVDARYSVWPEIPAGTFAGSGVDASLYCTVTEGAPAPPATCPAP